MSLPIATPHLLRTMKIIFQLTALSVSGTVYEESEKEDK